MATASKCPGFRNVLIGATWGDQRGCLVVVTWPNQWPHPKIPQVVCMLNLPPAVRGVACCWQPGHWTQVGKIQPTSLANVGWQWKASSMTWWFSFLNIVVWTDGCWPICRINYVEILTNILVGQSSLVHYFSLRHGRERCGWCWFPYPQWRASFGGLPQPITRQLFCFEVQRQVAMHVGTLGSWTELFDSGSQHRPADASWRYLDNFFGYIYADARHGAVSCVEFVCVFVAPCVCHCL